MSASCIIHGPQTKVWVLEEHWSTGDKFEIEFCASCICDKLKSLGVQYSVRRMINEPDASDGPSGLNG